jgi:hypothetical protein
VKLLEEFELEAAAELLPELAFSDILAVGFVRFYGPMIVYAVQVLPVYLRF